MTVEASVASLRRYPVKSMAGEGLGRVALNARGLVGDRWYAVEDAEGHFASGKSTRRFRRHDAVFEYAARTADEQRVIVTGTEGTWTVGDPALDAVLSAAMATPVSVTPEREVAHQDMGQVSLVSTATLAWCERTWGITADPRRLRVNLVVKAETPFVEEQWVGKDLLIGSARLRVVERTPRCRMIDIDQDGARADGRWLKALAAERDHCIAVYADVTAAGEIAVGDQISVG